MEQLAALAVSLSSSKTAADAVAAMLPKLVEYLDLGVATLVLCEAQSADHPVCEIVARAGFNRSSASTQYEVCSRSVSAQSMVNDLVAKAQRSTSQSLVEVELSVPATKYVELGLPQSTPLTLCSIYNATLNVVMFLACDTRASASAVGTEGGGGGEHRQHWDGKGANDLSFLQFALSLLSSCIQRCCSEARSEIQQEEGGLLLKHASLISGAILPGPPNHSPRPAHPPAAQSTTVSTVGAPSLPDSAAAPSTALTAARERSLSACVMVGGEGSEQHATQAPPQSFIHSATSAWAAAHSPWATTEADGHSGAIRERTTSFSFALPSSHARTGGASMATPRTGRGNASDPWGSHADSGAGAQGAGLGVAHHPPPLGQLGALARASSRGTTSMSVGPTGGGAGPGQGGNGGGALLEAVVGRVIEASYELLHAERVSLFLLSEDGSRLVLVSSADIAQPASSMRSSRAVSIPVTSGIAGAAAVSGTSILVPDAYADPRFNRTMDMSTGFRTQSILAVPITYYPLASTPAPLPLPLPLPLPAPASASAETAQEASKAWTGVQSSSYLDLSALGAAADETPGGLAGQEGIVAPGSAAAPTAHAGQPHTQKEEEEEPRRACAGVVGVLQAVNRLKPPLDWPMLLGRGWRSAHTSSTGQEDYALQSMVAAEFNKRFPFTAADAQILQVMAGHSAGALSTATAVDSANRARRTTAALLDVLQAANATGTGASSSLSASGSSSTHDGSGYHAGGGASMLVAPGYGITHLIDKVVEAAYTLLDCERVTLFLLDPVKQELWMAVSQDAHAVHVRIPIGRGLAGTVAATGQPLNVPDAYEDPRFDRSWDARSGFRTFNVLVWPVAVRGLMNPHLLLSSSGTSSSSSAAHLQSQPQSRSASPVAGGAAPLSRIGSVGMPGAPVHAAQGLVAVLQAINKRSHSVQQLAFQAARSTTGASGSAHAHSARGAAPKPPSAAVVHRITRVSSSSSVTAASAAAAGPAPAHPPAPPPAPVLSTPHGHGGHAHAVIGPPHTAHAPTSHATAPPSVPALAIVGAALSAGGTTATTTPGAGAETGRSLGLGMGMGIGMGPRLDTSSSTLSTSHAKQSSTGPHLQQQPQPLVAAEPQPNSTQTSPAASTIVDGGTGAGAGGAGGRAAGEAYGYTPFDEEDERAMNAFCGEVALVLKKRSAESALLKAIADAQRSTVVRAQAQAQAQAASGLGASAAPGAGVGTRRSSRAGAVGSVSGTHVGGTQSARSPARSVHREAGKGGVVGTGTAGGGSSSSPGMRRVVTTAFAGSHTTGGSSSASSSSHGVWGTPSRGSKGALGQSKQVGAEHAAEDGKRGHGHGHVGHGHVSTPHRASSASSGHDASRPPPSSPAARPAAVVVAAGAGATPQAGGGASSESLDSASVHSPVGPFRPTAASHSSTRAASPSVAAPPAAPRGSAGVGVGGAIMRSPGQESLAVSDMSASPASPGQDEQVYSYEGGADSGGSGRGEGAARRRRRRSVMSGERLLAAAEEEEGEGTGYEDDDEGEEGEGNRSYDAHHMPLPSLHPHARPGQHSHSRHPATLTPPPLTTHTGTATLAPTAEELQVSLLMQYSEAGAQYAAQHYSSAAELSKKVSAGAMSQGSAGAGTDDAQGGQTAAEARSSTIPPAAPGAAGGGAVTAETALSAAVAVAVDGGGGAASGHGHGRPLEEPSRSAKHRFDQSPPTTTTAMAAPPAASPPPADSVRGPPPSLAASLLGLAQLPVQAEPWPSASARIAHAAGSIPGWGDNPASPLALPDSEDGSVVDGAEPSAAPLQSWRWDVFAHPVWRVPHVVEDMCDPHTTMFAAQHPYAVEPTALERADVIRGETRLQGAVYRMLLQCGGQSACHVPLPALPRFLSSLRAMYYPNPFHNWYHAVSVQHAAFLCTTHGQISACLTPRDVFATLLASLGHDVGHPGSNNAHQAATLSTLALLHNDDAVLERHHAATVWRLLMASGPAPGEVSASKPDAALSASVVPVAATGAGHGGAASTAVPASGTAAPAAPEGPSAAVCAPAGSVLSSLSYAELRSFRRTVVHAILHTDMGKHYSTVTALAERAVRHAGEVEAYRSALEAAAASTAEVSGGGGPMGGRRRSTVDTPQGLGLGLSMHASFPGSLPPVPPLPFQPGSDSDRDELVAAIVHAADLSGQAYPLTVSRNWGTRVIAEFRAQAAAERAVGLTPAPFMDNLQSPLHAARLQASFVSSIVLPLWQALGDLFPPTPINPASQHPLSVPLSDGPFVVPLSNLQASRAYYERCAAELQALEDLEEDSSRQEASAPQK